MVTINNTSFSTWGLRPISFESGLSVTGIFDMPRRLGDTERSWGDSVEAFLDQEDIIFDGRKISVRLLFVSQGDDSLITTFSNWLIGLSSITLNTDFGNFNVVFKDEMKVTKRGAARILEIELWENEVSFLTPSGASGGTGFRIDGYNFQDFGITILKTSDYLDTPKRIEVNTTEFYENSQYREPKELQIEGLIKGNSKVDFWSKLNRFYGLLAGAGTRIIQFPDNTTYHGYVKDGVSAKRIWINGGKVYGELSMKFREVQ